MHEEITHALANTTAEEFRTVYAREHATTRRVLHAFPAGHSELKPHERSVTARQLAWTFVLEELMMLKVLSNEPVLGSGFGKAPDSWDEILDQFDQVHNQMMERLQSSDAASLHPVQFFAAPKTPAEYAPMAFLWRFLSDQIHHRGQLSVYLRMAGGKVPSIYGPSGDEPWF